MLRETCLALICCALLPSASGAQSLFGAGMEQAGASLVSAPNAPIFAPAAGGLIGGGAGPIVEARALALTDADGLKARRASRLGNPMTWRPYSPPSPRAVRREAQRLRMNPPGSFSEETELMCIAVSIYHEARNQSREGQAAVASVILNRAANPERWGMTPCDVVVPVQFSYLTPDRRFAPIRNLRSWATAVDIAAEVLIAGPDARLQGADHYHATYVNPPWNKRMDLVERIQDHIFWRSRPALPVQQASASAGNGQQAIQMGRGVPSIY